MAYRYHGRASVDPSSPRAFAVCDRCGRWDNQVNLKWQMQYAGPTLVNLRLLVCDSCLDTPQQQLRTVIIPADPPPVYNARPEPFVIDETDWLSTQDDDVIDTQDGESIITRIPNPDSDPENPT
jgi:hypothetical protein